MTSDGFVKDMKSERAAFLVSIFVAGLPDCRFIERGVLSPTWCTECLSHERG